MRWILDACTLIYLIKAKIFTKFMELINYPVVIDSSVYQEVVIDGKANNYPDAIEAEKLLNNYRIPIISIDVSKELFRFVDPGETSCYLLGMEDGICLTSDDRAYRKFMKENLETNKEWYENHKEDIKNIREDAFAKIKKEGKNFSKNR